MILEHTNTKQHKDILARDDVGTDREGMPSYHYITVFARTLKIVLKNNCIRLMYNNLCRPGMTRKLTAWAAGHISQELKITCGPLIFSIANTSRGDNPAVMPVKQNNANVNIGHQIS